MATNLSHSGRGAKNFSHEAPPTRDVHFHRLSIGSVPESRAPASAVNHSKLFRTSISRPACDNKAAVRKAADMYDFSTSIRRDEFNMTHFAVGNRSSQDDDLEG